MAMTSLECADPRTRSSLINYAQRVPLVPTSGTKVPVRRGAGSVFRDAGGADGCRPPPASGENLARSHIRESVETAAAPPSTSLEHLETGGQQCSRRLGRNHQHQLPAQSTDVAGWLSSPFDTLIGG